MHVSRVTALAAFTLGICLAGAARANDAITAQEHFVEHGGVRLRIWEKVQGAADGKPIVVLAHGSATAGQESFDLQVPGTPAYSLMDFLAREGFDVFAPDIRGFGRSTKPDDGVTTDDARDDLKSVIDYVLTVRTAAKVRLVAWSWGTQYAGLYAMQHSEKIARYVSYAQMHAQSPDLIKRRGRLEEFRKAPYMVIPEAAWKKRFASMTPEHANDADVIDAFANAAAAVETKSPTGPHIDMVTRMPMVDAAKITVPTLLIHGQFDDVADAKGLNPFFVALRTADKTYVIVPDAGHMAHLQRGHARLQQEIAAFLKR